MKCIRQAVLRNIFHLWVAFLHMNCFKNVTYFHLGIVFLRDELFQASTKKYSIYGSPFPIRELFQRAMYFHLRIAFNRRKFKCSMAQRISIWVSFFYAMYFSRRATYSAWESCFSDELIQAHVTYFHLRIVFQSSTKRFTATHKIFHLRIVFLRDEFFQSRRVFPFQFWESFFFMPGIVPGAQKI